MAMNERQKPEPDRIPQTGHIDAIADEPVDLGAFEDELPEEVGPESQIYEPDAVRFLDLEPESVEVVIDRDDDLGGIAVRGSYTSDGQEFWITAISMDERSARDALFEQRVWLEAVLAEDQLEEEDERISPSIEERVIHHTIQHMNAAFAAEGLGEITVEDLCRTRDENSDNHSPTLREVIGAYSRHGIDVDDVLKGVITSIQHDYPQVPQEDVEQAVEGLAKQPDVPDLDETLGTDDMARRLLRSEVADGSAIVYDVDVERANIEEFDDRPDDEAHDILVSFLFDPTVNKKRNKPYKCNYRARRQKSVRSRLHADRGRMTLRLWRRNPHLVIGSKYANAAKTSFPSALTHQSGRIRPYDIWVRGWENNSGFHLHGTWTIGKH